MAAETLTISCGDCVLEGTDACAECVVSFVLGREPGDAVVIDAVEVRAMRLLEGVGLVPALRHERRVS
jgi:hypothetical protein